MGSTAIDVFINRMRSIDIDDLVKQILSDLTPTPVQRDEVVDSNISETKISNVQKPQTKVVTIQSRVVTLANVNEAVGTLWDKVKRIIVPPKAIITPSVRDELRKKNIVVEFDSSATLINNASENIETKSNLSNTMAAPSTKVLHVWFAIHALKQEPKSLLDFLSRQYRLEKEPFECIVETMRSACEKLDLSTEPISCVVLTRASAAAICVANRQGNTLRAVLGTDPNTIKADAEQVGANLLIVDPIRSGQYKTQNIVKTFLADGVRNVPEFLFL